MSAIDERALTDADAAREVSRGYDLRNSGRLEEAIDVFRAVIAARPGFKEAYIGWETCCDDDDLIAPTKARLDAFSVESEEDYGWWLERLLQSECLNIASVGMVLDRALGIYADSPNLFFSRARWLVRKGELSSACEALEKVVAAQPEADSTWLREEVGEFEELAGLAASAELAALIARIDLMRARAGA
jgi:hypothetical protein